MDFGLNPNVVRSFVDLSHALHLRDFHETCLIAGSTTETSMNTAVAATASAAPARIAAPHESKTKSSAEPVVGVQIQTPCNMPSKLRRPLVSAVSAVRLKGAAAAVAPSFLFLCNRDSQASPPSPLSASPPFAAAPSHAPFVPSCCFSCS